MVKFNCLIHKETGTVIKYEDWKEILDIGEDYSLYINTEIREFEYDVRKILFGDDFDIIYDSEFTTEELIKLYDYNEDLDIESKIKINELIGKREYIKNKYRIEV